MGYQKVTQKVNGVKHSGACGGCESSCDICDKDYCIELENWSCDEIGNVQCEQCAAAKK